MTRTYFAVALTVLLAAPAAAEMKQGKPDLKSAGPLAFSPDGVLFIGDAHACQGDVARTHAIVHAHGTFGARSSIVKACARQARFIRAEVVERRASQACA